TCSALRREIGRDRGRDAVAYDGDDALVDPFEIERIVVAPVGAPSLADGSDRPQIELDAVTLGVQSGIRIRASARAALFAEPRVGNQLGAAGLTEQRMGAHFQVLGRTRFAQSTKRMRSSRCFASRASSR